MSVGFQFQRLVKSLVNAIPDERAQEAQHRVKRKRGLEDGLDDSSGENEPSTLWIDLVEGASVALRKDVPANLNVPEDAHFQWVFFGNLIKNKHHIARQ